MQGGGGLKTGEKGRGGGMVHKERRISKQRIFMQSKGL
jgi:hypothetical protein